MKICHNAEEGGGGCILKSCAYKHQVLKISIYVHIQ